MKNTVQSYHFFVDFPNNSLELPSILILIKNISIEFKEFLHF